MPSKHTKGPWREQGNLIFGAEIGSHVCKLFTQHTPGAKSGAAEEKANARLIASAPELLTCCEATLSYLMFEPYLDKEQLQKFIKETVAKARGEL
jgi:hypothetical protein